MEKTQDERRILISNGQDRTIFVTSVPRPLVGLFLEESKLTQDQVSVWVIKSRPECELDNEFKEALDGKMDESMTVGEANLTYIKQDELQQKLVEYELKTLGIKPKLESKVTHEKLPTINTIKIDVTATVQTDILSNIEIISDRDKLPASFVLDFRSSTLDHGLNTIVSATSKIFGPIIGAEKTLRNLKLRMIDADVLNERRSKNKPSSNPSQRLILIFI